AVVHLHPLSDVERRRGDARAQRFEDRVAPGDRLGVIGGPRPLLAVGVRALRRTLTGPALAAGGRVALLGRLALARHVPAAVLRLRRGSPPLQGLAAVTAGALAGALLPAVARSRAPRLRHRCSNAFRPECPPERFPPRRSHPGCDRPRPSPCPRAPARAGRSAFAPARREPG